MPWFAPLAAVLVIQTTATILSRIVATLAPPMLAAHGWSAGMIGWLSALNTAGSVAFLLAGTPLIYRLGSIRSLQGGMAVGVLGALMLVLPLPAAALAGSFLMGLCYGPSVSGGGDILQRLAPPQHRNLLFSIKQAGVPLGGVLAGLALPFAAAALGWRGAILAVALLPVLSILAVQPMRAGLDAGRDRTRRLDAKSFLSPGNLLRPLSVLGRAPGLVPIGLAGCCMAIGQGAWFAFLVTYAAIELHFTLPMAGALFATMQMVSIGGRMLLGWVSDRVLPGLLVLRCCALASAAATGALALSGPHWPAWTVFALAALAGIAVSSWNGVQNAEMARLAPPGMIAETMAGGTILIFLGYIVGPPVFGAVTLLAGGMGTAFMVNAAATLLALVPLTWLSIRRSR
ncbi:MFS transporter [Roseomonas haemaphysalidis]|uniref:MFS transporter n=1 Tax=Roseomonas haemaphysalidis TaxID=2768162 RepID=A0ABS3KK01_9PROT|nr:MFS transporter [Roseomonas haemaphysalidis]MBO1077798.1 MFS transporter [Roseomonas haemaphysalidis]